MTPETRQKLIYGLMGAAVLVAFAFGRMGKPEPKIEYKDRIVEKQVTTDAIKSVLALLEQTNSRLDKMQETQSSEKFHQEVLESWGADGSRTKKTTTDKNVDAHTKETETRVEVKVVEVEKKVETERVVLVDKVVEKTKIVTPILPEWDFGVGVGVSPSFLPSPKIDSFVVTGEVNHRLVGPVWVGLWGAGTTQGQAMGGIKVKLELR